MVHFHIAVAIMLTIPHDAKTVWWLVWGIEVGERDGALVEV